MEEAVREVLYETRYHATRPYSSNYPPHRADDGVKGGLFSLLSAGGLNQLKEKWNEYKRPRKLKKCVSLFISPRGEHVAVAVGNQITVLQKDDDYKEPCGIFTNDRFSMFVHGTWSDCHDILGVIDEMDTLYFVKANGEEITRITQRELKMSVPIIGLISQDDPDAKSSCLCSFGVLTSDGLFHHIEVSRQPSASIASIPTSNDRLTTLKKHFPQNVSCLDFHPALSLLVVVGSTGSVMDNIRDNAGFYSVSLWHRTRNLDLELVFCTPRFEGIFSTPKGHVGSLTIPKVAISPLGKYVAALDWTGGLDVFNLDCEQGSLSIIAFSERSYPEMDDMLRGSGKCFNDIADFTWWSNNILVLAKRSGVVTMIDIPSNKKLLENDPVFTMPILGRVQQHEGFVFLLETTPSEVSHVSSAPRETINVQDIRQITQNQSRFDQIDSAKLRWSLMSFSEKSVSEMYNILLSNQQYQIAMEFANRHGLDRDKILKSQWLHSDHGRNGIKMFLSKIKDQVFVLSECLDKVGSTEDAVKDLLAYGLRITDQYRFSESENGEYSEIWDFRIFRLQLLQFRDRLETFIGINMGRFSVQEYSQFRIVPLNEAAESLAVSGKIGALNLLFKRHPYSLAPFMLDILASIPETVPVQTYGQLLPGRSPTTVVLREKDWVESEKMVNYLKRFPKNHDSVMHTRTESIVEQCLGFVWPSVDELSIWYKNRAREIDSLSGQLDNCLYMVEIACRKGLVELQQYHEDISYLYQFIYTVGSDEEINISVSLATWEQLSNYEKFKMMLKGVKEDKVVERLREKAIPFMQHCLPTMASASEGNGADDHYSVGWRPTDSFLVRWLVEIASENKLDICLVVIEEGCRNLQIDGFFKDEIEAVECALRCIYLCTLTDRWNTQSSILSKLPQIRGSLPQLYGLVSLTFFDGYDKSSNSDPLEKSSLGLTCPTIKHGRVLALLERWIDKPKCRQFLSW